MDELESLLTRGLSYHQVGDLTSAEQIYREALRRSPTHAPASHYLGVVAHQRGEHAEAERLITHSLQQDPNQPFAHNNLGEVFRAQEFWEQARRCYERALELAPEYAEATSNVGICLLELGATDEAIERFERALSIQPGFAEALLNLGNAYRVRPDLDAAARSYRQVQPGSPVYVDARLALSAVQLEAEGEQAASVVLESLLDGGHEDLRIHLRIADLCERRGDHIGEVDAYRRALAISEQAVASEDRPGRLAEHAKVRGQLGMALKNQGYLDEAETELRAALEMDAAAPHLQISLASVLNDQDKLKEAKALLQSALANSPDLPQVHNSLGINHEISGDLKAARGCFQRAMELDPNYVPAVENLSTIRKFGHEDTDLLNRMTRIANGRHLPRLEQRSVHFSLGKMHQDLGEWDDAFENYRRGNQLRREEMEYDHRDHESEITKLIETFDESVAARELEGASSSKVPIFVIGMPRSGTTLIEQILASHPDVHGCGELSFFHDISFRDHRTQRLRSAVECFGELDGETIASLTRTYLKLVCKDAPDALRVTDKMPTNYFNLGLIAAAFPRAKIVYCVRGALDNCVSIYFQNFTVGNPYAWDLFEIGHRYAQHVLLMAHWEQVLPDRIFAIRYERMVREQETSTRELLSYCGLPWDERCLRFFNSIRPVSTASSWQVRQPIYTGSIGRWCNYDKHLDELRAGLTAGLIRP